MLQQNLHRWITGLSGYFSDDEIEQMPYSQKILVRFQKLKKMEHVVNCVIYNRIVIIVIIVIVKIEKLKM